MVIGMLAALLFMAAANLALSAALYRALALPDEEERNEALVEAALRREAEKADPMDEGFENIMRFSVNGKTGFEPE